MKTEFRVTAKTVDEAYTKALDLYSSLGEISMEEIISSGKKGFLGIGSKMAEIRITVDDGKEERKPKVPKQEFKKPQQTNEKKPQQANDGKLQDRKQQQANDGKLQDRKPAEQVKKANEQAKKPVEKKQNDAVSSEKKQQIKKQGNPAKQQKQPQGAKKEATVLNGASGTDENASSAEYREKSEPIKEEDIKVTVEEKTIVKDFLEQFIKDIGLDCTVIADMTKNEEGYVSRSVSIEGENASSLIGHHGETLDSLQYLANLSLSRKTDGDHKEYIKIIVDIENYRAKREQSLRALARRMSEKAIKYKRNVLLEPMNPYERRIIHSEVQAIEGVSTHSVGYDENRKIVITYEGKKAE